MQINDVSLISTSNEFNINFLLPPIQYINIELIKQIKDEIQSVKDTKIKSKDLFNKLSLALQAVRSIETESKNENIGEMKSINTEIIENVIGIVNLKSIKNKEDIDFAIDSNLIIELLDLLRRTPIDLISMNLITLLQDICIKSTKIQSKKLFKMEIFQILVPKLQNLENDIQSNILQIFMTILFNGLKQRNQASIQLSSSQNDLQQLIHAYIPHPYLSELQQQGIIERIIKYILINQQEDGFNKYCACQLLDILYFGGIILPPDIQSNIIKYITDESCSDVDTNREIAFGSLSYLAINQDNHQLIISGGSIEAAVEYINKNIDDDITKSYNLDPCFILLNNLFIFGSEQIKQKINNLISKEQLIKLKNQYKYAPQLLSSFSDPETMKQLMNIKRSIQRRNEEQLIELIKANLIEILKEIISKAISESDGEGKIILVGEIISSLIQDNTEVSRIIIDETDFVEYNINLLKSLSLIKIKKEFIYPLIYISMDLSDDLKKKLFDKGIIQLMIKIIDSEDKSVRQSVIQIIYQIIESEITGLKEQQQHPYNQQLNQVGTVLKLIQLMKNKDYEEIHYEISLIFSNLFKALPLPEDIIKEVIEALFHQCNIEQISLLAESQDNHDVILSNQFEQELFKEELGGFQLECLCLSLNILRLGSYSNKKKVALSVKDKVIRLIIDEYIDELGEEYYWDDNILQEIKSKAELAVQLIKSIEEEIEQEGDFEEINGIQFKHNELIEDN